MDCNSCDRTAPPATRMYEDERVQRAAHNLACLLAEAPAFEEFVRLAHSIRQEPRVSELVNQINACPEYAVSDGRGSDLNELQAQLEALPVVQNYRTAEQAARQLFAAVDQVVSSAVGAAFAENAKPAACG